MIRNKTKCTNRSYAFIKECCQTSIFSGTFLIFILVMCLKAPELNAGKINEYIATTGFSFLKINPFARPSSMAGSFTADAGPNNLFINPAAAANIEGIHGITSYSLYFADTQCGFIGVAKPYKKGGITLGIQYINYGEMIRADENGNYLGTFSAADIALKAGYSAFFKEWISYGLDIGLISSKIDDYNAAAIIFDAVAVMELKKVRGLWISAGIFNMGSVINGYTDYKDDLPKLIRIGAKKTLAHAPFTFLFDASIPNDNDMYFSFGGELNLKDIFFIRAGVRTGQKINAEKDNSELEFLGKQSYGFGFSLRGWTFDYAFIPDENIDNVHRFSISGRIK